MTDIDEQQLKRETGETQTRVCADVSIAKRGGESDDSREFELSFSSEYPVQKWDMEEVLVHEANSVRLELLNDKAPLLVEHKRDDMVGVIEKAWLDEKDRKCRAIVRFGNSARAKEMMEDVKDGIRTKVSVAYKINAYEVVKGKGNKPDRVRVVDWTPNEVSLVSVPADPKVGPGRSHETDSQTQINFPKEEPKMTDENKTTQDAQRSDDKPAEATAAAATEQTRSAAAPAVDEAKLTADVLTAERKRTKAIEERASKFLDVKGVSDAAARAIEEGWTEARFNTEAMELIGVNNSEARSKETQAPDVDLSKRDQNRFSIRKLMAAMHTPNDAAANERAAFELDVCRAAEEKLHSDYRVRGSFVPDSALSNPNAEARAAMQQSAQRSFNNTSSSDPQVIETMLAAGSFIDIYRNMSALANSGMMILPGLVGNVDIPRQATSGAASWTAEDANSGEGSITFDLPELRPKEASIALRASRRLLYQSTPGIDGLIMSDMAANITLLIDRAGLHGTGNLQPTGIAGTTGVSVVDFAEDNPTYAEIVNMKKLVMEGNALRGTPRWIIESTGWEALMTTTKTPTDTASNFILNETNQSIIGHPVTTSEQVDNQRYFFGDFSQLLCGEWTGYDLVVDPYTQARAGAVNWISYKSVDYLVRHPKAFAFGGNIS